MKKDIKGISREVENSDEVNVYDEECFEELTAEARERMVADFNKEEKLAPRVKDTGNRTKFETGSHKDIAEGRGRYDLIPLSALAHLFITDAVSDGHSKEYKKVISYFIGNIYKSQIEPEIKDKIDRLMMAYYIFATDLCGKDIAETIPDLARLYEAGANKYEARDWEKGRPQEVFTNSILRHFFQYLAGEDDEDHATAVLWNLISLIDTLKRMPSMAYTLTEYKDEEPKIANKR